MDGVIYLGEGLTGVYPGPDDIIITGRSYEEAVETYKYLNSRGIYNQVYFNPLPFDRKTRETSGLHKSNVINKLKPTLHFEDDPIQAAIINRKCPDTTVIHIIQNLVCKENERHD